MRQQSRRCGRRLVAGASPAGLAQRRQSGQLWRRLVLVSGVVLGLAVICAGCAREADSADGARAEAAETTAGVSVSTSMTLEVPAVTAAAAPPVSLTLPSNYQPGSGDAVADQEATTSTVPLSQQPLAQRERAGFTESAAPSWPFEGVVQLWSNSGAVWWLRYWSEGLDVGALPQVPLVGLEVECLGQVALVSHGESGIEVGGVSGSYLVRWGEPAQRLDGPSDALLAEIDARPSTLQVGSVGDVVSLAAASQRVSYTMRDPARQQGTWWRVQARHDGPLLVLSVHPAHLECFSGVTWLVEASSGEIVACGANTWATRYVAPSGSPVGGLQLPDPERVGSYLDCGARLELTQVPIRSDG